MSRKISRILLLITIALIGFACSRKKDKFLNRVWHDVTTKNNTLYNGRLAFDDGKADIVELYADNFWEQLPIERMIVSEDVRLPNEVLNDNFDRAEEKAIKAIQKHTMLIDGRERNPKIDEAFLLLGKSRYFEQRFIPALEAFNYILYKHPSSNTINHAKVWKAKANLRLDNNEKAIKDLTRMLEQEYMKPQEYADALSMISQAYINLKEKDSAVTYINKAAIHTTKNAEKGRYLYIKGQLLNDLGHKDSANYAFDQVIALNRKSPRRYMINAYLAKARNFDYDSENKEAFFELLTELEENRENRPFLDKIYHHKAVYFKTLDSIDLAIEYYNKSLLEKTEDKYLKSMNYHTLGNINFDYKEYSLAAKYYDSTLENMVVDSKKHRVLKKKRDNLDDVILYEDIANRNDSILSVYRMTPKDRLAYYTSHTDALKQAAEDAKRADDIARAREGLPVEQRFNQPGAPSGEGEETSTALFYFYNQTTVSYGKIAFKKTFGNRELVDNWKISSITNPIDTAEEVDDNEGEEEEYSIDTDPLFDPETYISKIPTDPVIIDSLQTDRNSAYYQLGVIYKEKFQEYDLAIEKLEGLLKSNPEERLILPSKYNLYKIFALKGNTEKANYYMRDIINNHGDSRYAQILQNPGQEVLDDQNSPKARYNKLYKEFQNQNYSTVIKQCNAMIIKFGGDEEFLPKFELLKAYAVGRYRGYTDYKKSLGYVALNYPQSPEGKHAIYLQKTALPKIANSDIKFTDNESDHKLVYEFSTLGNNQAIALKEHIEAIIKELRYEKMTVSLDVYDSEHQFIVVHTHKNKLSAEGLGELLSLGKTEDTRGVDLTNWNRRKKYFKKVELDYMVIDSPNYRTIQVHKNLDAYKSLTTNIEIEPDSQNE